MANSNVLTVNVKLNADGSMLINGVKKSREEVEAFGKSSNIAKDKVKEFGDSTAAMGSKVADFGKSIAGLVVSLAAAGGALYKVAQAGLEFETKISQLAVITGATGNDLDLLKNKAISLGNELGRTGSAFAEAAAVMGSQRPELLKMPAVLAETTAQAIILAKAANAMGIAMSDADAAKYLGGTLNQFKLEASDSARVINVFTSAAKEGSALVGDLAESMKQAGGTFSNMNISIEESAGVIETLAKFNIVGSEAGIAARNFFNIIASSGDKLTALGISASEVNPAVVGLDASLRRLSEANMSAADITYLFGMENTNAAIRLIQNREEVQRFTKAVTGTNAAYDAAKEGSKTLEAQWKNLTARVTNLAVGIYEHFAPALTSVMSIVNTSVDIFTGLAVQLGLVNQSFKTTTEFSSEFKNSLEGLAVAAGIVGVGGVLWAGFALAPVMLSATVAGVSSLTAALFETSVAATAASGSMGALQIAGGALFAAFAGWKIGSYMWTEFSSVREAGYWAIGGLQKLFIDAQIGLVELSGFFQKVGNGVIAAFQNPLSLVKTLFLEFSSFIQQKLSDFVNNLSNASMKIDFLPGMGDATTKLSTFSNELQISAKRMANAANETDFTKQATAKNEEINKSVQDRIASLIQEKEVISESQTALMSQATAYQQIANNATVAANAVQKVAVAQKKTQEINKGASIGEGRKLIESLTVELNTVAFDNDLDKKLAELRKKVSMDLSIGDSAITKEKAKELLDQATAQSQLNFLVKESIDIGKEREKTLANGNIAQELTNQYNRITFLTDAQRAQLVQEKSQIEVIKLLNEVRNKTASAGMSEEQARVNELMKQYSGIISETTAKNIASIEKQSKGYGELRGAYDKLQVASVISEQNELITLSQKYGESIGKQVFEINNLAKARQDAQNAQKDVQLAGLTGVQKDVATTAIKYGGDVNAAKEIVALQRQKAATDELVSAQKELANSGLTESQRKYLDLAEKIGASAAKESLEMRNLAEARKAGVAELQKSMEELQSTGLSDQAKSYFETIKNVAPEYRNQIIALKQQTEEIQKQSAFQNEIANKVADQFALIATGQKSVSQGWKDMAGDVGSMLQKVAADQMKNQIMQLFGANNPQQDAMSAIKAAQQADADRAKQFQISIQEVDLSVKKTIEERSIDASSKMGSTISDGVNKLQTSLETALSNLNQSMPKAIESFGKQMSDAISNIKIPTQQDQMLKAQTMGFEGEKSISSGGQKYDFSQSQNQVVAKLAQIAEKQGVAAEDLIRFAKIESNFNPNAKNQGSGAAGMFQFIPSTAKAYGIRGNEFDMEANTLAAIRLWKDNAKSLSGYVEELNGAMAYLAHQQGAGGTKDILRAAQGDSFHLSSTRRNINANVAGDIEKYTGVSKGQFQAMGDSDMAKTFVDYWQKKFDAIPLDKYGKAMGEATSAQTNATAAVKTTATVQNEQTTVVKQATQTQAQMLDEQNKAFFENSQNALKAAESVGVLGLNSLKGSDMIASGAQLAAAKIMNIADARVAAIYNMKATGADQKTLQNILNANSVGNASGLGGIVSGSQQDQMLADQMSGFDTSATGFFSDFSLGMKSVVGDVNKWIGDAKNTVLGWTNDLGLTGSGGLFGGADSLLGGAAQWAGVAGSILKGDIQGAITGGISVGANLLGTAIAGPIGGMVAGFAANALMGLAKGGGETRSGGAYRLNEKGDFNKIQGPSGGDIGGKEGLDKVSQAMGGTVKEINNLLEKLGSKAKVVDFTSAVETSDKGRGGVWAGGKLSTGQTFGEQFNGQNVFESQTSRTLNKDEAMKAYVLDLKQATLQAIQSASDVPKFISNLLKDVDIESLDETKVQAMLTTIETVNGLATSMTALGFSADSITQTMIESSGGIETFKATMDIFTSKFAGEQDKTFAALNDATSNLEKNLSALGGAIPQSRDALVDMVKGLNLTEEAGQQAFGSLMKLMPALDQYYSIQEDAVNKYFEVFGTAQDKASRSQQTLTKQFDKFGLEIPKSEAGFQALVLKLNAGDQAAKNQAIALMNLYPQWKANQNAQVAAGNSLAGFTDKLRNLGNQIDAQSVNQSLVKGVSEAKSAGEAGTNFSSNVMDSIKEQMTNTMMSTISDMVTTGIVQPMINAAMQSAVMDTSASVMSATNDVTASAMAGSTLTTSAAMGGTALTTAGAGAGAGLTAGGQTAGEAVQTGGTNAGKSLEDGGKEAGIKVDDVIAKARTVASTMIKVMNDPQFKADIAELEKAIRPAGEAAYQGSQAISQGFAQFTPPVMNFSNNVQSAGESAGEAGDKAAEAAVDFTKFKDSLKDFATGLEGDDLKMSKIQAAFKDVDLSSLNLSGSLENMASQIANLPDDKLSEIASAAKLSVDDMQSYVLDFFSISRQRAKEESEKAKEEAKALADAYQNLQVGIKDLTSFEPDQNKKTLGDLGTKYGDVGKSVLSQTSSEYLKLISSLKPEEMKSIATSYGVSVDEFQKDLLDAGGALKSLGETARDKAVEDFKTAMDAINGSLGSIKTSIENINPQSAEQILEKTKNEWQQIISSGQNIDKLSDATDQYQNAIEEVRQKQLKAIEDYRAGINKAIEDSQSFKKTLGDDIFNLRKTLGKSGTSNVDQMGLIQKQLSGVAGKSQADLEKQTELQGKLKDLILGNLEDQINAQQQVFDAQKQQFETQLDNAKALIDYAKDLKGFVDGLMLGDTSILTNEQRVNESQRQYQELLGKAKSGDQEAIKGLSNAASTYLKEARTYFASSDAYTGIFKDVTNTVSSLAGSLESQGISGTSSAQSGLASLSTSTGEANVKGLQETALAQLMALETARQQTETDLKTLLTQPPPQAIDSVQYDSVIATVNDAAKLQLEGIQGSLQTLENSTVQSFGTNINQLSANIGMSSGQIVTSIQGMQADFGGRLSAIVGVVQQAQADAAAAQAQLAAMQAAQAAMNAGSVTTMGSFDSTSVMPSYDVGTPYVEGDQVAQIHDGEMVIDRRSSDVLRNYGIPIQQNISQNNSNSDSAKQIKLLEENNKQLSQIIQVLLALLNENEQQSDNLLVLNEVLPANIKRAVENNRKQGARA